jgi:release factor glutamine methyltransferase
MFLVEPVKMPDTARELVETSGLPSNEARLLVADALGRDRAWIMAHADAPLDARQAETARSLLGRRRNGEPIAYILGRREFHGVELMVSADVLIPRAETELLVDLALERIGQGAQRVLDLATGSGAIAIAIACAAPRAEVWATDASPAALAVARANTARLAPRVRVVQSDWFAALASERFDLVAANPPYVATNDPHLLQGDLRFEPRAALVGGADGLGCVRRVVSDARQHLAVGGWLLFEHGYDQSGTARALLEAAGYAQVTSWQDFAGIPRVSGGHT